MGCGASSFTKTEPERPKVVVLNIKGGKVVRGDIIEVLRQSEYPLVPKREYIKTARKLKAKKLRARHITKVSGELGISAVISGRVKRRGKRRYLYITVHDGGSGARVERFRVRLTRKRALTQKGSAQLEKRLLAALSELGPIDTEGDRSDSAIAEADEPEVEKKRDRKAIDPKANDKKETRAERRRRLKREKAEREKAEREREKAEREEREKVERERERAEKRRVAREKAAREKREREAAARKKREREQIKKVANPETDNSGQAIDEESPF